MKEENQFTVDPFDDSDISSDDSSDFDSPEKPTLLSRFICRGQTSQVLYTRHTILNLSKEFERAHLTGQFNFRTHQDCP